MVAGRTNVRYHGTMSGASPKRKLQSVEPVPANRDAGTARKQRIASLRAQIEAGTYHIDSVKLSRALIEKRVLADLPTD